MISIEEMILSLGVATLLLKPSEMMKIIELIKNFRSNIEKQIMNQASRFVKFCGTINKEGEAVEYNVSENGDIAPLATWEEREKAYDEEAVRDKTRASDDKKMHD